ncbi:MAG: 30S ribosomal protein S20 [Minisyncoccia bacterium]
MPITKSAKRALKKSLKKQQENKLRKETIKRVRKELSKALSEKNKEEIKKLLPLFYKAIDKAVKTNVLKKNTANRMKSKIAKKVHTLLFKE